MSLLDKNYQPEERDYKILGAVLLAFGIIVAGLVFLFFEAVVVALVILAVTATVTALYFAIPPIRPLIYSGWMALFYPIGWFVSHALLAVTYYVVLTPIGLVMRVGGYDPMGRKRDGRSDTNWGSSGTDRQARRYFQQF